MYRVKITEMSTAILLYCWEIFPWNAITAKRVRSPHTERDALKL